jgi:hypothetical protein
LNPERHTLISLISLVAAENNYDPESLGRLPRSFAGESLVRVW